MQTRFWLRCVCVLALVILKGKAVRKSWTFRLAELANKSCSAAARRSEKVTPVQN